MTEIPTALCLNCGESSTPADDATACPHCGDTGIPADLLTMTEISITELELRILTYWAEGYARVVKAGGFDPDDRMKRVLGTIVDRLSMQTTVPLSMIQSMANLRNTLEQISTEEVDIAAALVNPDGTCGECGSPFESSDVFAHRCVEGLAFKHISPEDFNEHGTETGEEDAPPAE